MSAPTIRQRRQWEAEDGMERSEQLAKAAATLRLSLSAALLAGKPLERCIEVPTAAGPCCALSVVSDILADETGNALTSEMLAVIGLLAARTTPDPLSDRAAAWVDSVAHAHGMRWAEELADEWNALALDAAEV